jgi:hypothetical protein
MDLLTTLLAEGSKPKKLRVLFSLTPNFSWVCTGPGVFSTVSTVCWSDATEEQDRKGEPK